MVKSIFWSIVLIGLLIAFLSLVDIFANIFSFIPIIGSIAETLTEFGLEALQLILTSILMVFAYTGGSK